MMSHDAQPDFYLIHEFSRILHFTIILHIFMISPLKPQLFTPKSELNLAVWKETKCQENQQDKNKIEFKGDEKVKRSDNLAAVS